MCLWTCLHRDPAPVILPCSFRGGEKTSRSFSITPSPPAAAAPSPPFALTLISCAGGWWQAIHPALSSEHTCAGAPPSFPSHRSFSFHLRLSSSFPSLPCPAALSPIIQAFQLFWTRSLHTSPLCFARPVIPPTHLYEHTHTHTPQKKPNNSTVEGTRPRPYHPTSSSPLISADRGRWG